MNKQCVRCNNVIESERIHILPDTDYCVACAQAVRPKRVKGAMVFDTMSNSELYIMNADTFESKWKEQISSTYNRL
jgi:hypothetical protein